MDGKIRFENEHIKVMGTESVWSKYGKVRIYIDQKHYIELTNAAGGNWDSLDSPVGNFTFDWDKENDHWVRWEHRFSDRFVLVERKS